MARTIAAAFNQFAAWQKTTPAETDAARRHRSSLYGRLASEFSVKTFFRTGSFGSGTNVPKYSDVDYFAVMPELTFDHDSAKVLAIVAANLRQRFSRTNIRVDSPGIAVPFGWDRSEHTEIVPVIEDGVTRRGHRQFWMPDGYGDWMFASPAAHNEWVGAINDDLDGKLKPLIRMIKAWKYYRSVPIRSFYLEAFTAKYASSETYIDYPADIGRLLHRLKAQGLEPLTDPVFPNLKIEATKTQNQRTEALNKLDWADLWARQALDFSAAGQIGRAFERWHLLFDRTFPPFTGITWI